MQVLDLGGEWSFREAASTEWLQATVPGCVHTDLLENNAIDDPYFSDNEKRQMWIGETDWVYSRGFDVDKTVLEGSEVDLVCDGLDTLATVKINGKFAGRSDNAFRTWRFDVRKLLRHGKNQIEITFKSTIPYVEKLQKKRFMALTGVDHHRLNGGNQIRKSQCNYGWDWGPMCVTCGIWRAIRLVSYSTAKLGGVNLKQDHRQKGSVGLDVEIAADILNAKSLQAEIELRFGDEGLTRQTVNLVDGSASKRITIASPQIWWPNGMGEQPLYSVTVVLYDAARNELDRWSRNIGLRTVELVREADKWGESFYFAVNGKPFFAKGANWIPADTFVTSITDEWYDYLISSTAQANMNMLRVWGGGIYEPDIFYDLCDRYGIMIWQDFMFACSAYPVHDDSFVASVRQEAEDNIIRLRHHPCMALWCGNNEIEQMQATLLSETPEPGKMLWSDYQAVFDGILPELVKEHSPELPYWPSSPHTPGENRKDFNSPSSGDAHLWDVWHRRQPFEWYRTCDHRFNSEFGFQSFPEPSVVEGYTPPDQRNITSYVMELHQRSGIGNDAIIQYMLSWFRLPFSFDGTLWLSQILQGMAIKYAVEHWRRKMPQGMGTLYWQINDCWPVASWASIDHPGNWKALHYMARDFYAPLLVSSVENTEKNTLELWITNDLATTQEGTVVWKAYSTDGKKVAEGQEPCKVTASKSRKIKTIDLKSQLSEFGGRNLIIWIELKVGSSVVSRNLATYERPKHLTLQDPSLSCEVKDLGEGEFQLTVQSKKPALWVWPDLPGVQATYSDRFFHMIDGKKRQITVRPWKRMTLQQVGDIVQVSSLYDSYQ